MRVSLFSYVRMASAAGERWVTTTNKKMATAEDASRSDETTVAVGFNPRANPGWKPRRGATPDWCDLASSRVAPRHKSFRFPFRGLKSTATFRASLREAARLAQDVQMIFMVWTIGR